MEMKLDVLPIDAFEEQIVQSVFDNRVTIIVADTGAGKSTRVGQYLLKYGYKVVVTEPRRIAARSLADRVAKEVNCIVGSTVGYRTGFEQKHSPETKLLYVTDGLEVVREISADWHPDVLIIDEVHEWNLNIDVLIAWSKERLRLIAHAKEKLQKDPNFRLVIMSATLDTKTLVDYFGEAHIINVPGRLFPIEDRPHREKDMVQEVINMIHERRNILVFQPGKREINDMVEELKQADVEAEIIPLHAEMETEDQDKVFAHYRRPKVVIATNIAQTSLTIDDIDVVIDSGLIRQIETIDGIEMLKTRRISKADQAQRRGRAGRCRLGIYIDCYDGLEEQLEFSIPEIQRIRLDQMVLRLKIEGLDAIDLEFFHQPDKAMLLDAKKSLFAIGAMDKDGTVTAIGRKIAKFPVSVKYARMILAAREYGVVDDVLTIVACLEVKGINSRERDTEYLWQRLTKEDSSDLLAQFDLYQAARKMNGSEELRNNGIHPKAFFKALEVRNKLAEVVFGMAERNREWIAMESSGNREDTKLACLYGMVDHLYRVDRAGCCTNGIVTDPSAEPRRINKFSVVRPQYSPGVLWIVGLPFDLSIPDKFRPGQFFQKPIVNMVTKVDPKVLAQIAPHLSKLKRSNWTVSEDGVITLSVSITFNGMELSEPEKFVTSWADLQQHVKTPEEVEALRQEIIASERAQFEVVIKANYLTYNETHDWARSMRPQSKPFGFDPASGEKLYTFIAPVRGTYFGWMNGCFDSYADAEASRLEMVVTTRPERTAGARANDSFAPKQFEAIPTIELGTTETQVKPEWQPIDKRWWKCPNGHSAKQEKGVTRVYCEICRLSHDTAKRKPLIEPVDEPTEIPPELNDKPASTDQLSELANLFSK